MITNLDLITDSLRLLNVISEVDTPSADQASHALRRLNQMIEAWTEDKIELGYFTQSSPTDDCPIPAWAERGVIAKLAIDLAPTYGASVTIELADAADGAYGMLMRKAIYERMLPADMSHMAQGEGNGDTENILTGD